MLKIPVSWIRSGFFLSLVLGSFPNALTNAVVVHLLHIVMTGVRKGETLSVHEAFEKATWDVFLATHSLEMKLIHTRCPLLHEGGPSAMLMTPACELGAIAKSKEKGLSLAMGFEEVAWQQRSF